VIAAADVILAVHVNLVAIIIVVVIIIVVAMVADLVALAMDLVAAVDLVVALGFGLYLLYFLAAEEVAEDFSSNLINLKDDNFKVALVLDNRNASFSVSIILGVTKLLLYSDRVFFF